MTEPETYADGAVTIHHGDCLDVLRTLPDNSVHAVVTDPPYNLSFMGRAWDSHATPKAFQDWCELWAVECLRVLRPGGYMLSFGGTRTWHRLAVAVEDAGFEIRDSIAWLHGQGFPKGKQQLKPAFEPIVVARKPLTGTVTANVRAWGTGALNVDACRVETSPVDQQAMLRANTPGSARFRAERAEPGAMGRSKPGEAYDPSAGRWPANVALDGDMADAVGVEARFFPTFRYQAKAPTRERPKVDGVAHNTVKPLELMRWLVRLVTPPGGVVLEPFAGSGTTVESCILESFDCIAIEREAEYLPLIRARIDRAMGVRAAVLNVSQLGLFGDDGDAA